MCQLLSATGTSGVPDSHFHGPSIEEWLGYYNIAPDRSKSEVELLNEIFRAAYVRGTGSTGMFGLRMQRPSFDFFLRKVGVVCPDCFCDLERIQKIFGRTHFIHLTRDNKLDQAISYVKATQTGLWHKAPDGSELERLSVAQEPHYDSEAIARNLSNLIAMDASWREWFVTEGISPLCIHYEDLSDDPKNVLGGVLEYLGLDRELACGLELPVAKLADSINRIWAERFLAENPLD